MAHLTQRSLRLLQSISAARLLTTASTEPITVETSLPFTGHTIDPPTCTVETTPQELLSFYRDMALMRRMEIAADSLYKAKLILGFCHLYDGQEAITVGMEAAITKDCIITAYRDHCLFLRRGGTLLQSFGADGEKRWFLQGERGVSGFYGGHGIVGAQIPLGCGFAFARSIIKMRPLPS